MDLRGIDGFVQAYLILYSIYLRVVSNNEIGQENVSFIPSVQSTVVILVDI